MAFEQPLLERLSALARDAGRRIMAICRQDFEVKFKADGSLLTSADLAAEKIIVAGLAALDPVWPVVSEETHPLPWEQRRHWKRYWLIDPLDGTHHLVRRNNGQFTVNIALIEHHRSILGVVLVPPTGELFAAAQGCGAWCQAVEDGRWERLTTRALHRPVRVVASHVHQRSQKQVLRRMLGADYQLQALGSSLKCCLIARGAVDVYLRRGPTSQWDTAAAQCLLEEAGGHMLDFTGRPLCYNQTASLLNPAFIAVGDRTIDWHRKLYDAGLT